MAEDPFASPEAPPGDEDLALEDAEAIRTALLPREGAIRMAATPFWVVGGLALVMGVVGLVLGHSAHAWAASSALLVLGAALGLLAKGVRDVRAWSRVPALIAAALLAALGLALAWRAGRLEPMHAALLLLASMPMVLLSSRASAYLFSADYARVVRATPHLHYRAPAAVWVSLAVLMVAIVAIVWMSLSRAGFDDVRRTERGSSVQAG